MEVDQEQQFVVDTKDAGGQGRLEVAVVSVRNSSIIVFIIKLQFSQNDLHVFIGKFCVIS